MLKVTRAIAVGLAALAAPGAEQNANSPLKETLPGLVDTQKSPRKSDPLRHFGVVNDLQSWKLSHKGGPHGFDTSASVTGGACTAAEFFFDGSKGRVEVSAKRMPIIPKDWAWAEVYRTTPAFVICGDVIVHSPMEGSFEAALARELATRLALCTEMLSGTSIANGWNSGTTYHVAILPDEASCKQWSKVQTIALKTTASSEHDPVVVSFVRDGATAGDLARTIIGNRLREGGVTPDRIIAILGHMDHQSTSPK